MAAHKIFIRMKKEDSAFIYHVLEAHEGWAAYSTLPISRNDPYLDMLLIVPSEWVNPVNDLLESLKDRLIILPTDPSKT
jgi:hypothetical protein